VANKSLALEMADFLGACVRARLNILVSGGTGSGKTTLLNALSMATARGTTAVVAICCWVGEGWSVSRCQSAPRTEA
jgi:Flp pilus assembly CpaF family ATPase